MSVDPKPPHHRDRPRDDSGVSAETSCLIDWIDERFPVRALWRRHFADYRVPRNLNVWYVFGSLAMLVLVIQFVSGIFLAMHYKADAAQAFESISRIMREVRWGWLIRYIHTTGASLFFVVLYLHLFRGLIYGSYRKPRELVWMVGCFSFICMMAEAFFGYLLPWGQMSYWGAQVIINLFSAIPGIGPDLAVWIRGDYTISDVTLNRFFALHVIAVPLLLAVVVALHLSTLRHVGSSNPDGIDAADVSDNLDSDVDVASHGDVDAAAAAKVAAKPTPPTTVLDTLPFHPYFVVKDVLAAALFLTVFATIVFFAPTMGGYFIEADNFVPANPLHTPADIAPVWYFTAFYSMVRATTGDFKVFMMVIAGLWGLCALLPTQNGRKPFGRAVRAMVALLLVLAMAVTQAKLWGVVLMMSAVSIWFFLPWLDRGPIRSIRYRPAGQVALYGMLAFAFVALGVLGTLPTSGGSVVLAQCCTVLYFGFFLGMPWWSRRGRFLSVPAQLTVRGLKRPATKVAVAVVIIAVLALLFGIIQQAHAADPTAGAPSAPAPAPVQPIALMAPPHGSADMAALRRGATMFALYCANCHDAHQVRYEQLQQLGFSRDQITATLDPGGEKLNAPMQALMHAEDVKTAFGAVAPDLSLEAGEKGRAWLYTYLRSFYTDPDRPSGANNLLVPNVGMPDILAGLHGPRTAVFATTGGPVAASGAIKATSISAPSTSSPPVRVFVRFDQSAPGSLSAAQYDRAVGDLVAYMAWMTDPSVTERRHMRYWVLGFLLLFSFSAWRLARSYWRPTQ